MKTKILKWSFALAVVVAAGYTAYSSQIEKPLTGVTLDNVEAIASGEAIGPCIGLGNTYCPYNAAWVYRVG